MDNEGGGDPGHEIQQARDALADARVLQNGGGADAGILNPLYYACFHTAQTVLYRGGFKPEISGSALSASGSYRFSHNLASHRFAFERNVDAHKLLRAEDTLRTVYAQVEKTNEIERYENAPGPPRTRPLLPAPFRDPLEHLRRSRSRLAPFELRFDSPSPILELS